MSTWDSISREIKTLNKPDAYDIVRRQKIDTVCAVTGRNLVIYAVDFTNPIKSQLLGSQHISLMDKDGFEEVTRNLEGDQLDILLHSPGGSAEATESIVDLLRDRFSDIRFIVPNCAKSAATMLAMSGNQILMDERSELGPTDPQMILNLDGRLVAAPAQAIKDQFERAQTEVNKDPTKLPSWVPILRVYGPSLLAECDNHLALAESLVSKWLEKYMFAGEQEASTKAKEIARYLNDHNHFHSHARRIGIADLRERGVNILDMREDKKLHEAIRDLYTSLMLTFDGTGAFKIFENNKHEALINMIIQQQIPIQGQQVNPSIPKTPSNRSNPKNKKRK